MQILNRPRSNDQYKDRDIGCQEALEGALSEIARSVPASQIVDAAGGKLSPAMVALAKRAEAVGWSFEEAEVAISELAQNILDEAAEEDQG
jgi:hypothetical protein